MRVELGYPDAAHERELLRSGERRDLLERVPAHLDSVRVCQVQQQARRTCTSPTRSTTTCSACCARRASGRTSSSASRRELARACCARRGPGALLAGRDAVMPEDLQAVFRRSPRIACCAATPAPAATRPSSRGLLRAPVAGLELPEARIETACRACALVRCPRRGPRAGCAARPGEDGLPVELARRRLYILPTRAGLGFALLLLGMLVAGLDYASAWHCC